MKKIALAFIAVIPFFACSDYDSASTESADTVKFVGKYTLPDALPAPIYEDFTNMQATDTDSRSARPLPSGNLAVIISAKPQSGSKLPEEYYYYECMNSLPDMEFSLNLTTGTKWKIEINVYPYSEQSNPEDPSGTINVIDYEKPVLSDSYEKNITSAQPVINHTFILKPAAKGRGSIALEMQVDSPVSKYKYNLSKDSSNDYPVGVTDVSGGTITISHSDIPSGAYHLGITFYDADGIYLYATEQTLNVFDNMKTNTWVHNSHDTDQLVDDSGQFHLTEAIVRNTARTVYYVGSTAATADGYDDCSGHPTSPLQTVTRALEMIQKYGDPSKDYDIVVSGAYKENVEINLTNARKLTIRGAGYLDSGDILDGDGRGTVIKVDTTVPVRILDGIIIKNGYSDDYGGGVYVSSGSTVEILGCTFLENTAQIGGGAVYNAGTLAIGDSPRNTFSIPHYDDAPSGYDPNTVFIASGKQLELSAALGGTAPVLWLVPESYDTDTVILTQNSSLPYLLEQNHEKIHVADNDGKSYYIDSDGKLQLNTGGTVLYVSSSGLDSNTGASSSSPLPSISAAITKIADPANEFNTIYVLDDLTISAGQGTSVENLHVNIRGYNNEQKTITNTGSGSVFYIINNQNYTIENIKFTNTSLQEYATVFVGSHESSTESAGSVSLKNVDFDGITAKSCPAIAVQNSDSSVKLAGVSIRNCKITVGGDGSYLPVIDLQDGASITLADKLIIEDNTYNDSTDGVALYMGRTSTDGAYSGEGKMNIVDDLTGSKIPVRFMTDETITDTVFKFTGNWAISGNTASDIFEEISGDYEVVLKDSELAFARSRFYVSSGTVSLASGDDGKSGSREAPLATLSQAVTKINAADLESLDYVVYIDGNISGPTEISSLKANSLAVEGYNEDLTKDILNGNSSGSVLKMVCDKNIELKNIQITNGTGTNIGSESCGGGIYWESSGTAVLTMEGCLVTGNQAQFGAGIFIGLSDILNFKMISGEITSNTAISVASGASTVGGDAGGIYTRGIIELTGGKIYNNAASSGGGLYINTQTATATMSEGFEISGNETSVTGGGVWLEGILQLEGGKITANKSTTAGGVYVRNSGSVIMKGGEISGNECTGANSSAGGIYIRQNATVEISGGSITGNKCTGENGYGGGIYVHEDHVKVLKISGGTIKDNTATAGGNDIYVHDSSTTEIDMKGDVEISDFFLPYGSIITVTGPLSGEVGIDMNLTGHEPHAGSPVAFTSGYGTYNSNPAAVFKNSTYVVAADADGEACFAVNSGTINNVFAYAVSLKSSLSHLQAMTEGSLTITPSVTYTVPSTGTSTASVLYYNPADGYLYASDTFGTDSMNKKMTITASLYNGSKKVQDLSLKGSSKNVFAVPKLYEDSYSIYVSAELSGITYDAEFPLSVAQNLGQQVPSATFNGSISGSKSFISGRGLEIKSMIASDHEVTQGEYAQYMAWYGEVNPGSYPLSSSGQETEAYKPVVDGAGAGAHYPAYYVSWYEAVMYCNLRSMAEGLTPVYYLADAEGNEVADGRKISTWMKKTTDYIGVSDGKYYMNKVIYTNGTEFSLFNYSGSGDADGGIRFDESANGWRLPTAVEWEYLARGGNLTNSNQTAFSGSDDLDEVAWTRGNSGGKTHEVMQKKANDLGLYDMCGNVWEWCWDWYGSATDTTPATGPVYDSGFKHIFIGGSWTNPNTSDFYITNNGFNWTPLYRSNDVGFRVVRNAD